MTALACSPWEEGPIATVADQRVATVRWAQHTLSAGAVVVAIGTSDMYLSVGAVCEIAVIDTDGRNLLDTLVNSRTPVTRSARHFHQLSDDMLAGAPTFCAVLPDLLSVTAGRTVAAYHAGFVRSMILGECGKAGMDPDHLEDEQAWRCISRARSAAVGHPDHHLPLVCGPRAVAASHAALQVLRGVAASGARGR